MTGFLSQHGLGGFSRQIVEEQGLDATALVALHPEELQDVVLAAGMSPSQGEDLAQALDGLRTSRRREAQESSQKLQHALRQRRRCRILTVALVITSALVILTLWFSVCALQREALRGEWMKKSMDEVSSVPYVCPRFPFIRSSPLLPHAFVIDKPRGVVPVSEMPSHCRR